ncbi:hypothetical protein M405DRAFT_362166 [Rhizopogon salebrosus TDB-379]|nr:hypothetical protein M405DRAFT_362166 [Rhizopogon salebrosus TDB-379]
MMAATAGEDVAIYSSLQVAGQPPSPSDDPYQRSHSQNSQNSRHSRPVRKGTARPTSGTNTTTKEYLSAAEVDGSYLHPGSTSSLNLSLHSVGGSVNNNRTHLREQLRAPGSNLSGHELSRPHSRQQGHREEDSHSVTSTRTQPTRHLAPDMPYSRFASDSRASVSTGRSLVRSIAASESRQAAYRTHEGPINSRPVSIRGSVAGSHRGSPVIPSTPLDLPQALPGHRGSPAIASTPLDLPQALPGSDPVIDHHFHYTAPPSSGGQPGSEVMLYDGPPITAMVANDVRRYERPTQRVSDVSKNTVPAMTIKFPPHDMVVPKGWVTLVHPEGARYFVNQAHRTFTEMNICDEDICGDIEYYMRYLLDELQQVIEDGNIELDMQQIDLVIEPKVFNGDSVVCCYYFANHRDRCLFWLDDFNVFKILTDCVGVESLSHIQIAVQGQYWCVLVKVRTSLLYCAVFITNI